MVQLLAFISYVFILYTWVLVATVIMSWLLVFNVVNQRNKIINMIWNVLLALTEPVCAPIRSRMMPYTAGIDLSFVVVFLIIWFIQLVIIPTLIDHLH